MVLLASIDFIASHAIKIPATLIFSCKTDNSCLVRSIDTNRADETQLCSPHNHRVLAFEDSPLQVKLSNFVQIEVQLDDVIIGPASARFFSLRFYERETRAWRGKIETKVLEIFPPVN